jgi:hypothetical protein
VWSKDCDLVAVRVAADDLEQAGILNGRIGAERIQDEAFAGLDIDHFSVREDDVDVCDVVGDFAADPGAVDTAADPVGFKYSLALTARRT